MLPCRRRKDQQGLQTLLLRHPLLWAGPLQIHSVSCCACHLLPQMWRPCQRPPYQRHGGLQMGLVSFEVNELHPLPCLQQILLAGCMLQHPVCCPCQRHPCQMQRGQLGLQRAALAGLLTSARCLLALSGQMQTICGQMDLKSRQRCSSLLDEASLNTVVAWTGCRLVEGLLHCLYAYLEPVHHASHCLGCLTELPVPAAVTISASALLASC